MSQDCIFCKIIRREIPADPLYQDDLVTAFQDINPQRPIHVLIVPNRHIASVNALEHSDEPAVGRLYTVARQLAAELGIADDGFRLIVNTGVHGRQEVPHLHLHLVGGADAGPMLQRQPGDS